MILWGKERLRELLVQPCPHPAKDERYVCGCISCEQWRGARVGPGTMVAPATLDPEQTRPGTIPAWLPGTWARMGWSFRMEDNGITHAIVIGDVAHDDRSNGGHLDCVMLLCCDNRLRVTSRMWLRALANERRS